VLIWILFFTYFAAPLSQFWIGCVFCICLFRDNFVSHFWWSTHQEEGNWWKSPPFLHTHWVNRGVRLSDERFFLMMHLESDASASTGLWALRKWLIFYFIENTALPNSSQILFVRLDFYWMWLSFSPNRRFHGRRASQVARRDLFHQRSNAPCAQKAGWLTQQID
jgi:hypothetical protein